MTLEEAIARSIDHGAIVNCEWDGGDHTELVGEAARLAVDVGSVAIEDGKIDIWGREHKDRDSANMGWRLIVTLTASDD